MKTIYSFGTCLTILLLMVFFSSCSKSGSGSNPAPKNPQATVTITSLSVTTGPYNTNVVITGTGFSGTVADNQVAFNGKNAEILEALPTALYVNVPLSAGTGPVTVSVNSGTAVSGPVFTYQVSEVVTTFAGNSFQPGYKDGTGGDALFGGLYGLTIDKDGNLYAADEENLVIRKITPAGVVTTFAGTGKQGLTNGTSLTATFENPEYLTADQNGNVYVSDSQILRKISNNGTVSNVATTLNLGNVIYSTTSLTVSALTTDASGNLFITDRANQFIGKVDPSGTVTTIAGNDPQGTNNFRAPNGIVLDKSGNLFVIDGIVWKIDPSKNVTRFVTAGPSGQGFSALEGIAIDNAGNFYITDSGNRNVKKIAPDGTVTTIAGSINNPGVTDGLATKASFGFPVGIAVDSSGNIFVADVSAIREITFK